MESRVSQGRPVGWASIAIGTLVLAACLLTAGDGRAGSGGPDAHGYSWFDINDGCAMEHDTFVLANSDTFFDTVLHNYRGPIDIGFPFPWYEQIVEQIWVNRSGLIFFGEEPPDDQFATSQPIPNAGDGAHGFLAGFWDLHSVIRPSMYYQYYADPEHFKLSYDMVALLTGTSIQFEVYLYPTGDVRVEYVSPSSAPYNATIGTESFDETTGLEILSRGAPMGGLTYPDPTPFAICIERQSQLDCDAATPIGCGVTAGASPASVTANITRYSCGGGAIFDGNERLYTLDLTELSDLDITLDAGGRDMAVFLLRECDEFSCLDGGDLTASATTLTPGRYIVVVDGATLAEDGPFTLDIVCSSLSNEIRCEESLAGTTIGMPNRLDGYPCLPGDYSGPEAWFSVDFPPAPGNLNISVSSASGNLATLVLRASDPYEPESCVRGGIGGIVIYDAEPITYLIGVDGPAGPGEDFTLEVACMPELDCGPAEDISCNEVISGDTTGRPNVVNFYRCTATNFSGGEAIYTFTNLVTQPVSMVLDDSADERLDLILLENCNEGACREVGIDGIDALLDPGVYTLVVDGREGASGPFELEIICSNSIEPALIEVTGAAGECFEEHKQAWLTPAIPKADVMFSIDLTGSMGGERAALMDNMRDIVSRLQEIITDVAYGLISYRDYDATGTGTIPCAYTASGFGSVGDYPYRLEQPITTDRIVIEDAVDRLPLVGGGADGPESYNRVMYESYADPAIGWRSGSRRLLVDFGDELPHDCNVLECLGAVASSTRGIDIGRDNTPDTGDELATMEVVQGMIDNEITLVHFESSGGFSSVDGFTYKQVWDCWAQATNGVAESLNSDGTVPGGLDLVELVGEVIEEQGSFCSTLLLQAEPGYEDWLVSSEPTYIDVDLPVSVEFDIQICVPLGTPGGTYEFEVQLLCSGGVVVAQRVIVNVTEDCAPSVVRPPVDETLCLGDSVTLDASGIGLVNCDGVPVYTWRDEFGTVIATTPDVDVSPTDTTTYEVTVHCSVEPDCLITDEVTVEVHHPPLVAEAAAADISTCNPGIRLSWDAAEFRDPTRSGVYNIYRSEMSCADAVTRAPLQTGIIFLEWIDRTTRDGRTYHYVVEAEDARFGTACVPPGPHNAGTTARMCAEPVLEVAEVTFPESVFATLRMAHWEHEVTAQWPLARPLLGGETYRLLKAVRDPTDVWSLVNGLVDVSRSYTETDTSALIQFFDLRVANRCEDLSEDEYPAGYDSP